MDPLFLLSDRNCYSSNLYGNQIKLLSIEDNKVQKLSVAKNVLIFTKIETELNTLDTFLHKV